MNIKDAQSALFAKCSDYHKYHARVLATLNLSDDIPIMHYFEQIMNDPLEWFNAFPMDCTSTPSLAKAKSGILYLLEKHDETRKFCGIEFCNKLAYEIGRVWKANFNNLLEIRQAYRDDTAPAPIAAIVVAPPIAPDNVAAVPIATDVVVAPPINGATVPIPTDNVANVAAAPVGGTENIDITTIRAPIVRPRVVQNNNNMANEFAARIASLERENIRLALVNDNLNHMKAANETKFAARIESMEEENAELASAVEQATETLRNVKANNINLTGELEKANEKLENVTETLRNVKANNINLTGELEKANEKLEKANEKLEKVDSQFTVVKNLMILLMKGKSAADSDSIMILECLLPTF